MSNQIEHKPQEIPAPSKSQASLLIVSVLLTALITALLVSGGMSLWQMYSSSDVTKTSINERMQIPSEKAQTEEGRINDTKDSYDKKTDLIDDECTIDGCLFEDENGDAVVGFANLKGYYHTYSKLDWGDVEVTCDAIIVTDGSAALIDNFKEWIQNGNGLNRMSENGDLILNIDLTSSSPEDQSLIKSSTSERQVELDIIRPKVLGMGVSACASLVQIVDVK